MRADLAAELEREREEQALFRRLAATQGELFTGSITVHVVQGKPKLVETCRSVRRDLTEPKGNA